MLEVFERGRKQETAKRRRSWANPMAIRIPLWDPGRFLDRFVPLWRRIWGWPGAILWLAVVLPALVMVPPHWPDLTGNLVFEGESLGGQVTWDGNERSGQPVASGVYLVFAATPDLSGKAVAKILIVR